MEYLHRIVYNADVLLRGVDGLWYLDRGGFVEPLDLYVVNGCLAYRVRGGSRAYYRRKMERLGMEELAAPLVLPVGLP